MDWLPVRKGIVEGDHVEAVMRRRAVQGRRRVVLGPERRKVVLGHRRVELGRRKGRRSMAVMTVEHRIPVCYGGIQT